VIGKRYWSTGINLRYAAGRKPAWSGSLNFSDDGFASYEPGVSTVGELRTRYVVPAEEGHLPALRSVTRTLIDDADLLGIEFRDPYLDADPNFPGPTGWRELFEVEARRLGWGAPHSGGTR
jgi:hypothetical protein